MKRMSVSQSNDSLKSLKWLDESDASMRLEELVASSRMDVSDEEWINISLRLVGFFHDVVAEAEVNCSISCDNDTDLPDGWKVTLNCFGDAVRFYASHWLDKLIASERLVQILTYFFK